MAEQRLTDKVIFVTGGAAGIGLASARRFVEQGATVALADIDFEGAKTAAAEHERFLALALDVTDDAQWGVQIDETLRRFGRLDAVVNNAGIVSLADIEAISTAEWRRTMAVNVDSVFFGCRHAVRAMKARGGSIVNMSSVSGLIGGHNTVAYNASKGAVRLLTKSVALHCARKRYGIRCNSVHPTFVETSMVEGMVTSRRDPEAARSAMAAGIPLGRMGKPHEIADLLVYLVSDESQFVTGAELVIDGGLTAA